MPDYGKDLSWQDYFYDMILEALKNNNLSLLKMCGNDNCLRFFVQVDARQGFCDAKCRYEFNNRQRSEKGYFSVRREKRKRSDLNKARRLLQTGKSVMQVVDETRLSKRILERAGLLRGSR